MCNCYYIAVCTEINYYGYIPYTKKADAIFQNQKWCVLISNFELRLGRNCFRAQFRFNDCVME